MSLLQCNSLLAIYTKSSQDFGFIFRFWESDVYNYRPIDKPVPIIEHTNQANQL